jgi:glycine/D-amino acid oxidase-like deaminating enzyme
MADADIYDIVIIGGGVIGSSIAYWLSINPGFQGKTAVIERDSSYATASTALSAASIRLQFSNAINVAISKFGVDFIRNFAARFPPELPGVDLGFRENGYLFLASAQQRCEILRQNQRVQRAGGADTVLLDRAELKKRYPMLNLSDITLGSLGQKDEGWFDNMGLLNGLRDLAKHNGVRYLNDEVISLQRAGNQITTATLMSGAHLSAGSFVNAAGPHAALIAAMAGINLPVEPRKRTTFVFQAPKPPPPGMPLIVDSKGVYFKPEGQFWMGAVQPQPDPAVAFDDFEPRHAEFEDRLWPGLAARAPMFEAIKLRRMWAGHYAYNTLDQNALLGLHPEVSNLYFANGFSGHGLQQAPAVGRGIAELLVFGRYETLDMSPLGVARVVDGKVFRETSIV